MSAQALAAQPAPVVEPEGDLIQRAQRYEPEALAEAYDTNFDRIYSFVYAGIGDETAAEDLAGQIFVNALDALPNYRSPGPGMTAFLYQIAQSRLASHLRDIAKNREPTELHDQVRDAVSELPDDAAKVVMFRFFGGMDSEEIAHVTGFSHTRVLALQNRGLKLLHSALKRRGVHRE